MEDMEPLFHLNEVIPTKVTEHPALIPYLLSTQVDKVNDSQAATPVDISKEEEAAVALSLAEYNDNLEELLSNLPNKRRKYEE